MIPRKRVSVAVASLVVTLFPLIAPLEARAAIVERVVAVIGERPVLWSELLHRSASARVQIRAALRNLRLRQTQGHDDQIDPNLVSVQEQEMFKELLEKMIDERLEELQASKGHIDVSPQEIDRAIDGIAARAQMAVQSVLAEVQRQGMTEQDFRDEMRRQILEGKLLELRVRPLVHVTEQDARASYARWIRKLLSEQPNAPTPAFDEVKNDMMDLAVNEGLQRAPDEWLKNLKRNVFIDLRL
jgi:peptidyl-prolyl cis-trans isomerase SurA